MTANPINSSGLHPGAKLDKFEIVEQIGAGGMSIVWKAYDRLLDRFIAVKHLLPDGPDGPSEALVERFHRETETQKKVGQNHKHIVRVIDFIEEPRGLFILMEYVDGPSLEQVLAQNRKPMEERQALGIVSAAALGLEAIHAGGVIHRDLKPSNLLLPRAGGLKVSDFGLAALAVEQDALSLGSVRYMAPELFHDERVDARADIYSLGMIAYEMLAGREAFEEAFKIVLRDQRNQALRWMKWHTNPRAKAPPLSQLNPKVSRTLSDLVARMIEKDPAARISTARELLEAVRRHFIGAGDEANKPFAGATKAAVGSANPTAPLPKRSKLPMILVAILTIQLLIAAGYFVVTNRRVKDAAQAKHVAAMEEYRAAASEYDQKNFEEAATKFDRLAAAWPKDKTLGEGSRGWSLLAQGQLDLAAGRYEAAREKFDKVDQSNVFPNSREKLQTLRKQASAGAAFSQVEGRISGLVSAGNYGEARQMLAEARKVGPTESEQARLDELEAQNEARAKQRLISDVLDQARAANSVGDRSKAMKIITKGKETYRSADLDQQLKQYQTDEEYEQTFNAARGAEDRGDLDAAVKLLTRAGAIKPSDGISTRIDLLRSRIAVNEGRQSLRDGRIPEARDAFTRALGYRTDNPEALAELRKIETSDQRAGFVKAGDFAAAMGDYDAATKQYQNALGLAPDDAVKAKLDAVKVRSNVARAKSLAAQGKLTEARSIITEVLAQHLTDAEAKAASVEIDKRRDYLRHLDAGDVLTRQGKFDAAKLEYLQAREVLNTPEIKSRVDDTEYNQFITRARLFVNAENWEAARGILMNARQQKGDTDEVRELMAEVKKHLPAPGEEKGTP